MDEMTTDQIFKLIDAGYSKADIEAMIQPEPTPAPDPTPEQQPDPTPAPDPGPEPQPAPENNPEMEGLRNDLKAAKEQIQQLTQQVQQLNRDTKSVNTLPDADVPKKADAAMSELIRPTMKKRGG